MIYKIILFSACNKELRSENGTGSGFNSGINVFSFTGSTSSCTVPVINGSFQVGIAATASNTVQSQVIVTTIGTYSIKTATNNGLNFSASGTFTAKGLQTISFLAGGTPILKGSFLYSAPNSSSFTIPVATAGTTSTSVYTFPPAPKAFNPVTIIGIYTTGVPLTTANSINIQVNVTTTGTYNILTNTSDGIGFGSNGTFTTPGVQSIILIVTGKPAAADPFNYSSTVNGCDFTFKDNLPAPPATFTIQHNGSDCTAPVVNGVYSAMQLLNSSNTVQLSPDITVAGSYSITTNTSDGISFSGSGLFATTGSQQIILTGSGTPATAETFIFMLQLTGACSLNVTVTAAPLVTDGMITCKIDGVFTQFNSPASAPIIYEIGGVKTTQLSIDGKSVTGSSVATDLQVTISKNNGGPIVIDTYYEKSFINSLGNYDPGFNITVEPSQVYWATIVYIPNATTNLPFQIVITNISATRGIKTFKGTVKENFGQGTVTKVITEGIFNVPIM